MILRNDIILVKSTLVFGVSFWANRNEPTTYVYATLVKRYGSPQLHSPTGWKKENIVFVDFVDAPPMQLCAPHLNPYMSLLAADYLEGRVNRI